MNLPSDQETRLARSLGRALRELPALPAPRSLAPRVLAAIAREEALPWWRRNFRHWPAGARGGFLVLTVGVALLVLLAVAHLPQAASFPFPGRFASSVPWFDAVFSVGSAFRQLGEILLRNLPPLWLYGALALVAAAHVACLGLGAAAYRALRAPTHD
jgi:hypothetical protein